MAEVELDGSEVDVLALDLDLGLLSLAQGGDVLPEERQGVMTSAGHLVLI